MRRLVFRAQAELELAAAIEWYQKHNPRVAVEFAEGVDRILAAIQANPYQYQAIEGDARRAVMRDFSYAIVYLVKEAELTVVSVFHTSRDPRVWRDRLR
jgi:toxin ParE1/3/4